MSLHQIAAVIYTPMAEAINTTIMVDPNASLFGPFKLNDSSVDVL